jgi:hypothetical protein
MSHALTRQTITISPHNLQLLESIGDKVQADFVRMQPFLQQVVEAQTRMLQLYAPILGMVNRLMEVTRPILEATAQMQSLAKFVQPNFEVEAVIPRQIYQVSPRPVYYTEPVIDIFPNAAVTLPDGARWDYLECRFKDGHTLSVFYKGKQIGNFDHADLGFARRNTKDGKPDKQWQLLQQLSIFYESDTGLKPTVANLIEHPAKNKESCHKIKQSLANKLKSAFGIADSPFLRYDDYLGYRIRFKLRPEPGLRGDGELFSSGSKLFDDTTDIDQD